MIRPDYLLLGYYIFKIDKEELARASAAALKEGVTLRFGSDGSFAVSARQGAQVERLLSGIDYTKSELRGLAGFFRKGRHRFGVMAAIFVFIFIFAYLQGFVWDVRVEGEGVDNQDALLSELSTAGLFVGARWGSIDTSKIEARVLMDSDSVSWLNINRRGTVAYVSVVRRELHELPKEPTGYASIVAVRDCIIEEITVKEGYATVKVGQSVKRGDVLISGVLPPELGGGYCYADGSVKGRFSERVEVKIPCSVTDRVLTDEKIGGLSLKIFGFNINILKKYGNLETSCDIIDKKEEITILGARLPVSAEYQVIREYAVTERQLGIDEQAKMALDELKLAIGRENADGDLLSIKTDGEITDDGYIMWADTVVRAEVSSVKEFKLILE